MKNIIVNIDELFELVRELKNFQTHRNGYLSKVDLTQFVQARTCEHCNIFFPRLIDKAEHQLKRIIPGKTTYSSTGKSLKFQIISETQEQTPKPASA